MVFHQVIYNLLSFCSSSYSLRFCSNKLLQVPRSKLKSYGDRSFSIDLFHNGDQIQYSFVLMLISLISLTAMGKILKII